jgi:hypothetical protein
MMRERGRHVGAGTTTAGWLLERASVIDCFRVDPARESAVEGGREFLPERERLEEVEAAVEVRWRVSGDGGAGRLETRESRECREMGVRGGFWDGGREAGLVGVVGSGLLVEVGLGFWESSRDCRWAWKDNLRGVGVVGVALALPVVGVNSFDERVLSGGRFLDSEVVETAVPLC